MNAEKIKELRELVAAATAGPWTADGESVSAHHNAKDARCEYWICEEVNGNNCFGVSTGRPWQNAALIVAAVNALPALLDEVEALTKDAERYRWLRDDASSFQAELIAGYKVGAEWDDYIDAARHEPKDAE